MEAVIELLKILFIYFLFLVFSWKVRGRAGRGGGGACLLQNNWNHSL